VILHSEAIIRGLPSSYTIMLHSKFIAKHNTVANT